MSRKQFRVNNLGTKKKLFGDKKSPIEILTFVYGLKNFSEERAARMMISSRSLARAHLRSLSTTPRLDSLREKLAKEAPGTDTSQKLREADQEQKPLNGSTFAIETCTNVDKILYLILCSVALIF